MKFPPQALGRAFARRALQIEKSSPALLFGVGVVGAIGSTVLACRATLKLEEVLEKGQDELNTAKTLEHEEYSEKDRQKDVALIYVRTSMNVARLYAPAVVLGGASIAALAQSHNILTKRNAALTAAYAALERGFGEYRQRVIEKYGEDEDRNLRYGSQIVEIEDEETGKKKKVTRVADGEPSIYARFFDPACSAWSPESEYNLIFLRCQQNWANDLLRSRGHLFLNEVYDSLGLPRTKEGAVVGWILSKSGTDNYVDFGIFADPDNFRLRDFVNGREASILLDFNVDGVIFDKIETPVKGLSWQRD